MRDIIGSPTYAFKVFEETYRILEKINKDDLSRIGSLMDEEVPPKRGRTSFLHKMRILHFLTLNLGSNRYNLSKTLGIPHASTMEVVKELCSSGLIRISKIGSTRTGLPKISYKITSYGMVPLIRLYSCAPYMAVSNVLHQIATEVRKDFAQAIKNCEYLPFWNVFFRNWSLFERENTEQSVAFWLGHASLSYLLDGGTIYWMEILLWALSQKNPDKALLSQGIQNTLEEEIASEEDEFHTSVITMMLNSWCKLYPEYVSSSPITMTFQTFLLVEDLKHLLINKHDQYRTDLKKKLTGLRTLQKDFF